MHYWEKATRFKSFKSFSSQYKFVYINSIPSSSLYSIGIEKRHKKGYYYKEPDEEEKRIKTNKNISWNTISRYNCRLCFESIGDWIILRLVLCFDGFLCVIDAYTQNERHRRKRYNIVGGVYIRI